MRQVPGLSLPLAGLVLAALVGAASACSSEPPAARPFPPRPTALQGFAALPGHQVVKDGIAALRDARAVRITGEVGLPGFRFTVTAHLDQEGRCAGSVRAGDAIVRFVRADDDAYLRGSAAYWRPLYGERTAEFLDDVAGRWVKRPSPGLLDAICEPTRKIARAANRINDLDVDFLSPYEGRRAAVVVGEEGADSLQAYVDLEPPHHLLGYELSTARDGASLTFSGFGSAPTVRIPERTEYVVSNLGPNS